MSPQDIGNVVDGGRQGTRSMNSDDADKSIREQCRRRQKFRGGRADG